MAGGKPPVKSSNSDSLGQYINELKNLINSVSSSMVNQVGDDKILHAINLLRTDFEERLADNSAAIKSITEQLAELQRQQLTTLKTGQHLSVVPSSPFIHRIRHELVAEKMSVAAFVTQSYFVDRNASQKCFLQASTTAYHLMEALDADERVTCSHLIYTNSAVAHVPLLFGRSNSKHSVWPFRGHLFNNECGGWLIPAIDTPSIQALKELFHRKTDPLHTAFITPRYFTPDGGLYFESSEGASFASTLAAEAKEVVLLGTGDRVLPDSRKLPTSTGTFVAMQPTLNAAKDKFTTIISWPHGSLPEIATDLRSCFGMLHWECENGWAEV